MRADLGAPPPESGPSAVRQAVATAREATNRWVAWLVQRFRRSLQLRIVAATLGITLVVVLVVGYVLLNQIAAGLQSSKQQAALAQSSAGVTYVGRQLGVVGSSTAQSVRDVLQKAAQDLSRRGTSAGAFDVLVIAKQPDQIDDVFGRISQSEIPEALQAEVALGKQAYANATIDLGGVSTKVLIVGSAVPTSLGDIELYYVFPWDDEEQTLSLIQRTVVLAALALVLLVAGIGLLVSRLVVLPVRSAAQTAGQLADGQLDRRMVVRGEDDLARLAASFNNMAVSLADQIGRLEGLSSLQQRFTSDVSHELRTPLTTVRMAAEVLHDYREDFPAPAARSAELLVAELDRFETLLKDLLEISRYDAGGLVLEAEPQDITVLVEDVVTSYLHAAGERGSDIVIRGPVGPVVLEIDGRRVERVLRNLLSNALDHGEHRPVEVTVGAGEDTVAVTVRDRGIGLDPMAVEHIFDRFWRADPSRARTLGGTGLGLAISLEDARLHGGWLQVWGAPGRGASFRLTLPRRAGAAVTSSPLRLVPRGEPAGAVGGDPGPGPKRDDGHLGGVGGEVVDPRQVGPRQGGAG